MDNRREKLFHCRFQDGERIRFGKKPGRLHLLADPTGVPDVA